MGFKILYPPKQMNDYLTLQRTVHGACILGNLV